ncbi:hypothetical protein BDB00DRAFT_959307 [Zychaea mexicana]|uniref:uncharacterized protein n=1 Tax=Zychaea mexicana TaxID=64656 RepID=UPI0022FDD65E|nr:uncharacterized protein BDB00DRAFT_959307 [Zychaea mexicana]KAI9491729.1 hypothetical protein BDB00DRAFT_959307 [Zychaea mexicana]
MEHSNSNSSSDHNDAPAVTTTTVSRDDLLTDAPPVTELSTKHNQISRNYDMLTSNSVLRDNNDAGVVSSSDDNDDDGCYSDKDKKAPVNNPAVIAPRPEGGKCTTTTTAGEEKDGKNTNGCAGQHNSTSSNVAQIEQPPSPPITLLSSSTLAVVGADEKSDAETSTPTTVLTEASLAKQNEMMAEQDAKPSAIPVSSSNAIRAWAATLPEIPDSVQHTPMGPSHIFELQSSPTPSPHHRQDSNEENCSDGKTYDDEDAHDSPEPQIQETKDVFTDTQKIAYVGLCAVTSLEVVHDLQGKDFTYARMSADNWQRKLMRTIYMHMDISPEERKMIESLARHDIRPTDLVHQFTAQGETTTVNMGGYQEVQQPRQPKKQDDLQQQTDKESRQQQHNSPGKGSRSSTETKKEPVEQSSSARATTSRPTSPVINSTETQQEKTEKMSIEKNSESDHDDDDDTVADNNNSNINSIAQESASTSDNEKTESSDSKHNDNNMRKPLESPPASTNPQQRQSSSSTTAPSDTPNSAAGAGATSVLSSSSSPPSSSSSCSETNNTAEAAAAAAANGVDGQFVIDLRWTVMCDLFLLCLSAENYDTRSRVFIARMASYLELDWFQVIGFEKRITVHLMQNAGAAWETETVTSVATTQTNMTDMVEVSVRNEVERKSRNKQRRKKRYIMIGLATIGGGLILGLSAGLMAPVIAGGIGTILTTVGVTGTSGFLGGTAGIALITGGATAAGGGIGARSMKKRMKMINTFEFSPVTVDESVSCIVSISGWLPKGATKDTAALPFSTLDSIMGDHYTLYWDPEMLEALGSAFKIFATEAVAFSIQQALAHTIMGALLAGLAWPLALTKLGYLVDNPWNNGLDRARLAGLILADSLMNRNLGARPVTLVGYSLGARVIFYCLLELARVNAYGLVENVALFGTPVNASKTQWKECTTVVAGRFINGYATSDWLLGFLFRASTAGLGNVAGLRPLQHIEGNRVQNVDCTDLVKGHLSYRLAMPKLLKRAGFVVTSEELPDPVKESEEVEDEFVIDLSGAKDLEQFRPATMVRGSSVSSLTSGKASIQYPPPKTKCHPPRTAAEVAQQQQEQQQREQEQQEQSSPSPPQQSQQESSQQQQSPEQSPKITFTASSLPIDSPKSSMSMYHLTDDTAILQQQQEQQHHHQACVAQKQNSGSEDKTLVDGVSDQDIIADIIAKAAAVSKSSNNYSSLSSGRASIAQHRPDSPTMTQSSSDTTASMRFSAAVEDNSNTSAPSRRSISSSSLFSKSLLFNKNRKKSSEEQGQQELSEAGIEVKELKSTLGRMVVPEDVVNPMPKFSLEKPNFARVNR